MASGGAAAARSLYKLFVGNVPWTVSSQELKLYFSKFGHVNTAVVVFDKNTGLSRNYGFVTFSNQNGFDSATNVQPHKLEGNLLKVQPASTFTSNSKDE